MKKVIILTMVMFASMGLSAQNDAISKFFSKYADDTSFSNVNISSKMFKLFTNVEVDNPNDKEILDAINSLSGLRILAKSDISNGRELYKEAFSKVNVKEYEELMSIREKDQDFKFMIKQNGNNIQELLMISGGPKEFMIMSITGNIDLNKISKIGSKMNIGGLENLEKMNDKKNK
jgi:hypothetical protein